jgi:hypothetical protein
MRMTGASKAQIPMQGSIHVEPFARKLESDNFVFIPGNAVSYLLGLSVGQTESFGAHWDSLTLDRHMGDGGSYRYRRYGEFESSAEGLRTQLPHGPYEQPKYINALNGGIARLFDPLEPCFVGHVVLAALLDALTAMFNHCEGRACRWSIRLHPYRIFASESQHGQPTPEGLHRDGVDYVASLLMSRRNVRGAETTVTNHLGQVLWQKTLMYPFDVIVGNDHETMHAVSALTAVPGSNVAYRDVLVVAFTQMPT